MNQFNTEAQANDSRPDLDAWIYAAIPAEELLDIVCPGSRPPQAITHTEPAGALALWKEELHRGTRKLTTVDVLASAAAREANGLDALRNGLHVAASEWFCSAERVITEGARAKAKRAKRAA